MTQGVSEVLKILVRQRVAIIASGVQSRSKLHIKIIK